MTILTSQLKLISSGFYHFLWAFTLRFWRSMWRWGILGGMRPYGERRPRGWSSKLDVRVKRHGGKRVRRCWPSWAVAWGCMFESAGQAVNGKRGRGRRPIYGGSLGELLPYVKQGGHHCSISIWTASQTIFVKLQLETGSVTATINRRFQNCSPLEQCSHLQQVVGLCEVQWRSTLKENVSIELYTIGAASHQGTPLSSELMLYRQRQGHRGTCSSHLLRTAG